MGVEEQILIESEHGGEIAKKIEELASIWERNKDKFCFFVYKYYTLYVCKNGVPFGEYIKNATKEEIFELIDKTFDVLMHEKACYNQVMQ